MTSAGLAVTHLSFRYGLSSDNALDDVSFAVAPQSITGLLGRNGSGKSTVGLLAAGLLHPNSGTITLGGSPIFDDAEAMAQVAYAGDTTAVLEDKKLIETMRLWAATRPAWDQNFAEYLLDLFALNPKKKPGKLSRGQKSAFFATLGLASRASVTIFDEVHLGMDAVVREMFYRILLSDYTTHPRAILVSSHLIEEIEDLLDHVLMLHQGRLIESGDVDEIRARHAVAGKLPSLTQILMDMTLTDAQRDALGR